MRRNKSRVFFVILLLLVSSEFGQAFLNLNSWLQSESIQNNKILQNESLSYQITDINFAEWNKEWDSSKLQNKVVGESSLLYLNIESEISNTTVESGHFWDGRSWEFGGGITVGSPSGTKNEGGDYWAQIRVSDWYVMYFGLKFNKPSAAKNRPIRYVHYHSKLLFSSYWNQDGHLSVSDSVSSSHPVYYVLDKFHKGYNQSIDTIPRDGQFHSVDYYDYAGVSLDLPNSIIGTNNWPDQVQQIAWRYQYDWYDDGALIWDYAFVEWGWLEYYRSGYAISPVYTLNGGDKLVKAINFTGSTPESTSMELQYKIPGKTDWILARLGSSLDVIASKIQLKLTLMSDSGHSITPKITGITINYEDIPPDPVGSLQDVKAPIYGYMPETGLVGWDTDRSIMDAPAEGNLYVGSEFMVYTQITNTHNAPIVIMNAIISLECDKFETAPSPQNVFIDVEIAKAGFIGDSRSDYKTFRIIKDNFGVKWDSWTSIDLIIKFQFDAIDKETGITIGPISIYRSINLIKPPIPVIQFDRYEGPKDNPTDDYFIYKTDQGDLSQLWSVFTVTNTGWIPIKISQMFDYEPTWLVEDQAETGDGYANLLDIQCDLDNSIILYPGISEIRVQLDVKSAIFFVNLPDFDAMKDVTTYVLYAKEILDVILECRLDTTLWEIIEELSYLKNLAPVLRIACAAVSACFAALDTTVLIEAQSNPKNIERIYEFISTFTWKYQFGSEEPFVSYELFGYSALTYMLSDSNSLQIRPSSQQWANYNWGLGLHWTAIALTWTSIALSLFPLSAWVGFILSTAAIVSDLIAGACWGTANDPLMIDSNYTEVVEPSYRNLTYSEPTSSLDAVGIDYTETIIEVEGNLAALNTSIARKNAAVAAGDNQSIILQNEAIYNYSMRISEDYEELGDDVVRFENEYNKSITQDNITQIENHILEYGITEEERGNLTQIGLNETEINRLEDLAINISQSHSISLLMRAFRNSTKKFTENLGQFYENAQKQSELYKDLGQNALNDTITLKNITQNNPIISADSETQIKLEALLQQSYLALNQGAWSTAMGLATELKKLALYTIAQTLNQTYFSYVEEANNIIEIAEKKMQIELIPVRKEILIKVGIPETFDLIILNTGAPSGTYKLLSNSSWIHPIMQTVEVIEWKSTAVPLTIQLIESFDIAPGEYPINLTIYLEGTDTKKTIIIIAKVISTKVENNMNYIFYKIADLREEVDARVCFLFDWLIIGQLDNAEEFLNGALEAYHANATAKTVVLDKLAKATIELSDIITIILDWIGFISEEDGDFISNYLHTIRDHITLTMGATVGTEEAMKVAQIETGIKQLADQIFAKYNLHTALSLDIKLWIASENLDCTLMWMALECGDIAENHIILCSQELQCAKCVINDLKAEGKLPGDEADALILTLDGFIAELELLYTHPFHEGDGGTGDIPTHQETEESNNEGVPDSSGTGGQTESPNTEMPTH